MMKKVCALIMALALMLCLTVPALACGECGLSEGGAALTAGAANSTALLKIAATADAEEVPLGQRALKAYGIALVVGVIAALIVCGSFKAQMKSARKATSAKNYVSPMGAEMRVRYDRYTHTTRTERRIEQNSGGNQK